MIHIGLLGWGVISARCCVSDKWERQSKGSAECAVGEEHGIFPHLPPGILVSKVLKSLLDASVLPPSAARGCAGSSLSRRTLSIPCGGSLLFPVVWEGGTRRGVSEILGWHRLL